MKFDWRLLAFCMAIFAGGCVVHHHGGGSTAPEGEKAKETENETISKFEAEPVRVGKARETQDYRACPADLGLHAGTMSPSMPQVVVPDGVEIYRGDATLSMEEDGRLKVKFDVRVDNKTREELAVRIGYGWRVMRGGPSNLDTYKVSGESVLTCSLSSDPKLRVPFKEYFSWSEVKVPSGDFVQTNGSIVFDLDKKEKSESLFGFKDGFAGNWKNFDWPYTKAGEYAKISDKAKPYTVAFKTFEAKDGVRVRVKGKKGETWLRSYSYEQMTRPMKDGSSVVWLLPPKDGPKQISFEYLPGLNLSEQREVFEKIVESRPDDLRAKIHLSDLYLVEGNHEARVKVLKDLLTKWEKNNKEQLLIARNDVRGPAYAGLVVSLKILSRDDEALRYAKQGVKVLEQLSENLEMNIFAKKYLQGILNER